MVCGIFFFPEILHFRFPLLIQYEQKTVREFISHITRFQINFVLLANARNIFGIRGCLPFSQKIRKFRFEVKWKGNFPENLFGNCGQPPEVVHFFRSERNLGNALTICQIEENMRDGMLGS